MTLFLLVQSFNYYVWI